MSCTKDTLEHQINEMDQIENDRYMGETDLYMIVHKPSPELTAIFYIPATSQLESISKINRLDALYDVGIVGNIKAGGVVRLNKKLDNYNEIKSRLYWEPDNINNMHYIVGYFLEDYMKLKEHNLAPTKEYLNKCRKLLEKDEKYEICARIRDQVEKM